MSDTETDGRLKRDPGAARQSRAMDDREVTENRELNDDERLELFRQRHSSGVLPTLPRIQGYHTCWLSTTNPSDTIQHRMMLGYEPIVPQDVPGLELAPDTTGQYPGMIGVKEMLAFKLREDLYQSYMREAHYDEPRREEEKLTEVADMIRAQAEQHGAKLDEDDGMEDLRQRAPALRPFK